MPEMRRVRVDDRRDAIVPEIARSPGPEPEQDEEECDCPRLEAEDWHDVENDWSDIAFLRGSSGALLGVPMGYKTMRSDLVARADELGYEVPDDAMLLLGEGKFRRPVLLEVEPGDAPPAKDLYRPGGVAYTRLVPAPLGTIGKVVDETVAIARQKFGRKPDDVWLWYLTCRICSGPRDFETLIVAHFKDR